MAGRVVMAKLPTLAPFLRRLRPTIALTVPRPPLLLRRISTPPASASTSASSSSSSSAAAAAAPSASASTPDVYRSYTVRKLDPPGPEYDDDMDHWLVHMNLPKDTYLNLSRDEIITIFVKTLAQVLGSEDDARKRIYSMSLKYVLCFGARISEEIAAEIEGLPKVILVIPDSYVDEEKNILGILDIAQKDEEWDRNSSRRRGNSCAEGMINYLRFMNKCNGKITMKY